MNLLKYAELKQFATWKECSFDSASNESMVDSNARIIDFDRVKTKYMNDLKKSEECSASVDALGEDEEGIACFVEFKNGAIDNREIRQKVTESLLIYHDITHTSNKDTRENMDFILVYNPDAYRYKPQEKRAMNLARLGHVPCVIHGLEKFHGTWVRRAYMMTAKEFDKKMAERISV